MKRTASLAWTAGILALCLWARCAYGEVSFRVLFAFDGTNGAYPKGGLVQAPDGGFYGTTVEGGAAGAGTVFWVSADGQAFKTLYSFTGGADGANPSAALAQGADGSFYGTAYNAGAGNSGTLFEITAAGEFTLLASLSGADGAQPDAALLQANDGSWYGTTVWGGPYAKRSPYGLGYGTIFMMSTNGVLSTLYSFGGGDDGGWPYAGLVLGRDGSFYGTTLCGGQQYYGYGAIFQVTPAGDYTKLYAFTNSDGANPYAGLIQGSDGNLYGTTYAGGQNDLGTVFRVSTDGVLTTLHSFAGPADGSNPLGSLVQANDGNFYGTAAHGGAYSNGVIFRVSMPLPPVIRSVSATAQGVTLTWSAVATQSYQVQYQDSLAQTNWLDLGGPLTAAGGAMQATDPAPAAPQRWYRVLALP